MARLIDLDELLKFPIRIDHYDKEHGNEHFVYGIETVLEYAENLPIIDSAQVVKVETNIYDKEEIYPDCTVQVLTNTATGDVSVGWWKNDDYNLRCE